MSDYDKIPAGSLGSVREIPYETAPPEMSTAGLPYGAWCKCAECGFIGRSTFTFDFYGGPGEPLKCEDCTINKRMR